ncbi:MAG: tetratricopeptide repeat protein [Gemmatimonadetes bacterium]|nr:tetratricopeptide repeat protein [Gemmatimonadota bacterium]
MRKHGTLALLAALVVAVPIAAQDPVALVIRVQGDVAVKRGDAAPTPATVGERMFVGDDVLPAAGARAILITRTGGQQVVTEATTVAEPRGAGNPDIFARAMSTLAQAASTDATAGGRQGMIRPIPGSSVLVAPRNRLLVASQRPTFTWTATPNQSYDLMLRKVSGGPHQIYELGADTIFILPDEEELDAGATYAWTVFVGGRRSGRPIPQQEFRVMSLEESVDLEDYMEEISVFGLDPMTDGLFLTVVAFRDLGLFYDAQEALDSVERQASLSADLYLLKGEILTELGHEEAARAAFDKADELMR